MPNLRGIRSIYGLCEGLCGSCPKAETCIDSRHCIRCDEYYYNRDGGYFPGEGHLCSDCRNQKIEEENQHEV